ncbi:MAG: translocation/assembly module TamB domain-containing protein, partial [Bacteroidetes bacterium]|nr:translocation/assembly module TamB domain-containing protein [Bacteroidota bacterium]
MQIIKKIAIYITVSFLVLFCGLIIALQIPYIQTKLVQKATNILSEAINFPVKVEAVAISWFDTIILKGVSVEDDRQHEMIKVEDLKVDFQLTSIIDSNTINIDAITLKKANISLVKYAPDGALNMTNFIQALKNLSKKENKQKTKFTVDKIILKNSFFSFSDQRKDSITDGFDYFHFAFDSTYATLSEFNLLADTIQFKISDLTSRECIGHGPRQNRDFVVAQHARSLQINHINSTFLFTSKSIEFHDLSAFFGKSYISNLLIFRFDTIDDMSDFVNKVDIIAQLDSSVIHSQDLALFAPSLKHLDESWQISGDLVGKVKRFHVKNVDLYFGKNSHLRGSISFDGLPHFQETFIDLNLKNSIIEGADLKEYINLDSSGFKKVEKFGKIQLTGQFIGFPNDFVAYGSFNTAIGKLVSDINLKIQDEEPYYKGHLETYNFDLGELIGYPKTIQMIDMNGSIEGTGFSVEDAFFTLDANIYRLGIKYYDYKNITIDAGLSKELFVGILEIKDTNLRLKTTGKIDLRYNRNLFDIDAKLVRANLKPLNFSKQQTFLSTELHLDFKGLDIDEIVGSASFENTYISNNNKSIDIDFLSLLSVKDTSRSLKLISNLMDANISGDFEFSQLTMDLKRLWNEYKLHFENNDSLITSYYADKKIVMNEKYNLDFSLRIKDINPLLSIFYPELYISRNSEMEGYFTHGKTAILAFNIKIDTLLFKYNSYFNNEIELSTSKLADQPDVLAMCYIYSDKQKIKALPSTEKFYFEGIWSEKNINFSSEISQINSPSYASLYGDLTFLKDKLQLILKPSGFEVNGSHWQFAENNKITIANRNIIVENLKFFHNNEVLAVNGVISEVPSDILYLNILNFNLLNTKLLLNMQLNGILNGSMAIKDYYHNLVVLNKINIDEFKIEKFLVGDVTGFSNWDDISKNLDIDIKVNRLNNKIINDETFETVETRPHLQIGGYYNPTDPDNTLNLTAYLNNTDLQIIEPFLSYVVSDISGTANGKFRISGNLGNPVLKGEALVDNGAFKVNYLNTVYHFNDKIYFDSPPLTPHKGGETGQPPSLSGRLHNQQITFKNLKLLDENNNTCKINGSILHDGFKNFASDLHGEFTDFIILNTNAGDNDLYYGTSVATGDFEMLGPFNDMLMTANILSNKGTRIYIPLDSYEGIEEQDFIKFVTKPDRFQGYGRKNLSGLAGKNLSGLDEIDLSGIKLDLNLDLTTDAYIEIIFDLKAGDIIRGYGNGELKLEIDTRSDFNMYGTYEIDKGAYNFTLKNLINKEFEILPNSTITWNGDPYGGILNITAAYGQNVSLLPIITDTSVSARKLPEVKRRYPVVVELDMKGNLMSPQIGFDIDIKDYPKSVKNPNGPDVLMEENVLRFESDIQADEQELNRQVFSLLILAQLSSKGAFSGIQNYAFESVSELLSNQLNYWMSQVDENLEIDIDLSGLDANALNTFKLRLSYTLLEGRLRITREGSFTNVKNKADLSSIAGEWTVEYLISEDGKFRVKMYNKNNPNSVQTGLENTTNTS